MTYAVLFDVSERLPQLAVGIVAALALAVVVAAGLWDSDAVLARWALVLGAGAACAALQFAIGGLWPYLLGGAAVVGIVIALERAGPGTSVRSRRLPPGAASFLVGFFLLILAAFEGLPMVATIDLERRLASGQATIVEGPVTVESFGKTECLAVAGQRFCYSEAAVSPGYNRRQTIFPELVTGMPVRLSIIDGLIVRLEVGSQG